VCNEKGKNGGATILTWEWSVRYNHSVDEIEVIETYFAVPASE